MASTEREQFEAWAAGMDLRREYEGYADNNVHLIWHGWQARAGLSVEQEEELPGITDLGEGLIHEPSGCSCKWHSNHFPKACPYFLGCWVESLQDVCTACGHNRDCHTPSSLVEK